MGGNLAWTLRTSDGTEYRMDRWTNAMSGLINDPAFYQEDPAHMDECLSSWLSMKADWEKNQSTENFEHPMTPVYAPYPYGTKPSEYGIVVTDFQNKVVLSNQMYCSFDGMEIPWLSYTSKDRFRQQYQDRFDRIMAFIEKGMVQKYAFFHREGKLTDELLTIPGAAKIEHPSDGYAMVEVPGNTTFGDIEEIVEKLPQRLRLDIAVVDMVFDVTSFSHEDFSDTQEDWTRMLVRVQELGFVLSDEELQAWQDRIREAGEED